ncbi:hypothetical protein [Desulfogranum marinum]|uniref:hypothetical protein n=1 Tax=Desulfogranum marinum TaxID=453220 RepID=UPI0019650041|nr:hypothetical protein [Desulfogranum marinum]MBM9515122.1 hypothetical protein [Desulfogranum marinum]
MLLRNPNYLDVVQWMWRHILVSYGMTIYRNKLGKVGKKRVNEEGMPKSFGYFA